jgi:hypothetical protein
MIFEKTTVCSRRTLVGKVFFAHYEPRFRDDEPAPSRATRSAASRSPRDPKVGVRVAFAACSRPLLFGDQGGTVATLHIEHPISDLETWLGAFRRFEDARKKSGVQAQRVYQPVDDDHYIFVTLDFDSVAEASAFKSFLESTIWASAEASPALAGAVRARILTEVAIAP